MKCDKCRKEIYEKWTSGKTYEGIDYHHNPPKFMVEEWETKVLYLCRKCHRELHDEIIKILNEVAGTLKFIKSEHWVWVKMNLHQRKVATDRVIELTNKWVEEEDDTKTITK